MSESFDSYAVNFMELHNKPNFIDKFIMMFDMYQFNFFVAFFGFYIMRYLLPNSLLGNNQSIRAGLILAFFYATFGFVSSGLLDYKRKLDARSIVPP